MLPVIDCCISVEFVSFLSFQHHFKTWLPAAGAIQSFHFSVEVLEVNFAVFAFLLFSLLQYLGMKCCFMCFGGLTDSAIVLYPYHQTTYFIPLPVPTCLICVPLGTP